MQRSCSTVQGLKVQSQIRCACSSRSTARLSSKSCAAWKFGLIGSETVTLFWFRPPTRSTTARTVPTSEAHARRWHQKAIRAFSCWKTIGTIGTAETVE